MPEESGPRILSRRSALMLAAAGLLDWNRLYASAPDFWNKKPPSEWTPEEIDRLLTKSPWARQVTAQYAAGGEREAGRGAPNGGGYPGGGYPGGSGGGQRGGIGIGGIGIGMPRGRGGTGGGRGGERRTTTSSYTGTVRWESARPILDAAKTPLPEAFADHYVMVASTVS